MARVTRHMVAKKLARPPSEILTMKPRRRKKKVSTKTTGVEETIEDFSRKSGTKTLMSSVKVPIRTARFEETVEDTSRKSVTKTARFVETVEETSRKSLREEVYVRVPYSTRISGTRLEAERSAKHPAKNLATSLAKILAQSSTARSTKNQAKSSTEKTKSTGSKNPESPNKTVWPATSLATSLEEALLKTSLENEFPRKFMPRRRGRVTMVSMKGRKLFPHCCQGVSRTEASFDKPFLKTYDLESNKSIDGT